MISKSHLDSDFDFDRRIYEVLGYWNMHAKFNGWIDLLMLWTIKGRKTNARAEHDVHRYEVKFRKKDQGGFKKGTPFTAFPQK